MRTATGEFLPADEVIVCAGAYESPGVLLRSGIGPGAELAALGRSRGGRSPGGRGEPRRPSVGVDRPALCGTRRRPPGIPARGHRPQQSVDSGRCAGPAVDGLRSDSEHDGYGFCIAAALLKPTSRGRLRLRSLDAGAAPHIELGYFRDGTDLERLTECFRIAEAAAHAGRLPEVTHGARIGPPAEVVADDRALSAWIRATAMTYHHPVGTCAMGLDPSSGAVVDPDGRVHGVSGLSVIDAAVMPELPSANTNIPTIMLAEHLAARRWTGSRTDRVAASAAAP